MNDLRDRIVDALYEAPDQLVVESAFGGIALREAKQRANQRADKVMPIVEELAADLDHAERENRRLAAELGRAKR